MNDTNILEKPGIRQIQKTKTVVIGKKSETYPVYSIPLKFLYYNDQNDRISTEVIRHYDKSGRELPSDSKEYNQIFEELIVCSNVDAIKKTQKSIENRGQDNPGVVLRDGRIVDGNRRFTCLRRIERDTNQEQYFEAIVLNFDYKNYYKYIKAIELKLQMGVEEKVKYDPIDRLFGVYKSIRVEKAFTIEEYAKLFDDYPPSKVKDDLELADLMCEYLEFQGSPGKFYVAKDMKLDGVLHEIPAVLKKVKDKQPDLEDKVKNRIFSSIAMGASPRLNLFVRDIKGIVENGDLERYLEETKEAVENTIDNLDKNPIQNLEDLEKLRSNEEITEILRIAVTNQRKQIDAQKLKKGPLKLSRDALSSLNAIKKEILKEMGEQDRLELEEALKKLEDKIEDIRENICP